MMSRGNELLLNEIRRQRLEYKLRLEADAFTARPHRPTSNRTSTETPVEQEALVWDVDLLEYVPMEPPDDPTQAVRIKRAERAGRVLDCWSALLPHRIVDEEVGDYIEDVNRRAAEGQKAFVWVRCAMCIFWTGLNTISYLARGLKRVK